MNRLPLVAALILLAMLIPALALAKPPKGITIDVQVGYGGYLQPSQVNPVVVTLENNTPALNLSGELVLVCNSTSYTSRLELPTPSVKRFFFYCALDAFPPSLLLTVRTKPYTETYDLGQTYKLMKDGDTSIVVLTQQKGSLGAINQLPNTRMGRSVYADRVPTLTSGKTFVSYFDLAEIDPNPKFFARANVIVLADMDYQQVTPALAETIKACAAGGAGVVFSLGLNGAGVMKSPLAPLCPLQASGTVQLSSLGSFGANYGIRAGTQATLATGSLQPGAEVLSRAGTVPAVVRSHYGSGTITALAFDVTQAPFKQNPALGRIFQDAAMQITNSISVTNWFIHPESVSLILRRLTEADPLHPQWVLLFLFSYIVLIGPVNFIILSYLKRRTLVWTTIPLIISAFAWVGLSTGYLTRGTNNVCSYFQELHVFPNSTYTPYQTVMLVFTAERASYKVQVPDKSAFLFTTIPNVVQYVWSSRAPVSRMRGIGGLKVDESEQPEVSASQGQWTSTDYYYQGYSGLQAKCSGGFKAMRSGGKLSNITGSINLDLPFDLKSAYAFTPDNQVLNLGDLPGKGSLPIDWSAPRSSSTAWADTQKANYLVKSVSEFENLQRENSLPGMAYRDEVLIVGFTDQSEVLATFNRRHKDYKLTMAVLHLPLEVTIDSSGPPKVSPPYLTGGIGYEIRDLYPGQHVEDTASKQFAMPTGSYLDQEYELSGDRSQMQRLLIHLQAFELLNRQPIRDPSLFLKIQAWNGSSWSDVNIAPDQPTADLMLGGMIDSHNRVTLRFISKADCSLTQPLAEMY